MLKSIHVTNFKCLRDVSVELEPLTVLIGKNDTGKSSFLEAVAYLGELAEGDPDSTNDGERLDQVRSRGAGDLRLGWHARIGAPILGSALASYRLGVERRASGSIRVTDEQLEVAGMPEVSRAPIVNLPPDSSLVLREKGHEHVVRDFELRRYGQDADVNSVPALALAARDVELRVWNGVRDGIRSSREYRLVPAVLALRSDLWDGTGTGPQLSKTGVGLPMVLDHLQSVHRSVFDRIQIALREAVPGVAEILLPSFRENGSSGKGLAFRLATGGDVPASQVSDGVLLFLAYLTLVHAPSPPAIILLEEPENGVHPRQLERIVGYLKKLTESGRTQIIVATHSPYLLDFVPREAVRVFGRRPDGSTVVEPLVNLPHVKERLDTGQTLGELWFNVGEDKLLEGVIGAPPARE